MGNDIITFSGISKEFKDGIRGRKVHALKDLSLAVKEGEVFGFLGPNGAGKSTAIKILMNLIFPTAGGAKILGMDVRNPETRRHVGFLPENPYFYDYLSAEELLRFGGQASGLHNAEIKERSDILLKRLGLDNARNRPLRSYSKGMVQRAGLALALIHDPKVLILDEPMSGLDPIGRKMVVDLILDLKAEGKTVFFSSHILSDVERLCDRVSILINGSMVRLISLAGLSVDLEELFLDEVRRAGGITK